MSSKRNIPNKIRECGSQPRRKKHKSNPKHENFTKTAGNKTTSQKANMSQDWFVQNFAEFEIIFFFAVIQLLKKNHDCLTFFKK